MLLAMMVHEQAEVKDGTASIAGWAGSAVALSASERVRLPPCPLHPPSTTRRVFQAYGSQNANYYPPWWHPGNSKNVEAGLREWS